MEAATGPSPMLSPAQVARRLNVSLRSVRNWSQVGALVGGQRVKLDRVRVGGANRYTEAAVTAFIEACNRASAGHPVEPVRTARAAELAAEKAAALEAIDAM